MAWQPCKGNHDWEPIQGYAGRYKCALCHVIGYHRAALKGNCDVGFSSKLRGSHSANILPYLCPACSGPTTKKGQNCLVCEPKESPSLKEPDFKWRKVPQGWVLMVNGHRVAVVTKKIGERWTSTIKGKDPIKADLLPDAKRLSEEALGLGV